MVQKSKGRSDWKNSKLSASKQLEPYFNELQRNSKVK